MIAKLQNIFCKIYRNGLFKNSSWGVFAHLTQTIFVSLFFVIVARIYSTKDFTGYIVATVLYQLMSALSTLGLSQWFIRQMSTTKNKPGLVSQFFKMQLYFGIFFYAINVLLAVYMYDAHLIRVLSIIFGAHIIIDNLINAIKCLNIAEFNQKKTFGIISLEAFLKFLVACVLFFYPFSIVNLSLVLLVIRLFSLNILLKFGSSGLVHFKGLYNYKIRFREVKNLVILNWPFIIIGGVSLINWRIANIIISKTLTATNIANYEISYKIFSIAQILPVIISSSVFPLLIKFFNSGDMPKFQQFYKKVHLYYALFGFLSFTFIASFSDTIVPMIFGSGYENTAQYTRQMFFTILVFPTAFLQANLLIAMKLEKTDMWLNVVTLVINVSICLIGLNYYKSLTVVNFAIFISFFIFHVLQDILLVNKKIASARDVLLFYLVSIVAIVGYYLFCGIFNPAMSFLVFWAFVLSAFAIKQFSKPGMYKLFIKQKGFQGSPGN